jgi:uncharacterized membrane protein YoaK (UPF0700 family)
MDTLEPQDYVKNRYITLWGLLCFQAGCINSLGFLACNRFVSHVTGFGTQVGISLGDGKYGYALVARYDIISFLIPIIMTLLMIGGLKGHFGLFGGPLSFSQDVILLSSLTFLCGMQNACFATLTKGHIRTTHLTGITTDIGTDFALTLNGKLSREEKHLAIRRNLIRLISFSSFSTGALISAIINSRLEYWSFLIPITSSFIVASVFVKVRLQKLDPEIALELN